MRLRIASTSASESICASLVSGFFVSIIIVGLDGGEEEKEDTRSVVAA